MSSSFNPGKMGDWSRAFDRAEAYLGNKVNRPLQNNTRLVRVNTDAIAVVLHNTAVVTYHRGQGADGTTFTIYGGGWNSVTTKARIREWSPVSVYSHNGAWVVGYTDELTPARVQKCRSCKGRGQWTEADRCYGPSWMDYCQGATTDYRLEYVPGKVTWDEHWESRYVKPCEHGQTERHCTKPCEHGETTGHTLDTRHDVSCHRCDGQGRVDYGSQRIPITVSAYQAYRVDSAGTFLHLGEIKGQPDSTPYAPASGYPPSAVAKWQKLHSHNHWDAPISPAAPASPYDAGSEVADALAAVLPDVERFVAHPVNGRSDKLRTIIVTLNDSHGWSRERIADWLETLDLDLRFPTDAGTD
jgi:hypothetical protein